MVRPTLDYFILAAVAEDVQPFARIRKQVASTGSSESQLLLALRRLVQQRLVEAYRVPGERGKLVSAGQGVWPSAKLKDIWFRITGRGKMVHGTWASAGRGSRLTCA